MQVTSFQNANQSAQNDDDFVPVVNLCVCTMYILSEKYNEILKNFRKLLNKWSINVVNVMVRYTFFFVFFYCYFKNKIAIEHIIDNITAVALLKL